MELQKYLEILLRSKWVILATMAVATIVAVVGSFIVTPLYSATATLRLASAPGGSSDYIYVTTLTRLSNTYVEIATNDTTLSEVAERLGMAKPPQVEVELVPETELIRIKTTDPDPALARDIVNTLAAIMVEQSQQIDGSSTPTASEIFEGQLKQAKADLDTALAEYDSALRSAQSSETPSESGAPVSAPNAETLLRLINVRQQIYTDLLQKYETARTSEQLRANALTIIETATLAEKPSTPNLLLNLALGLIAGFAAAVILAFIFEGMDDTVRDLDEVKEMTTLPILCIVPNMKQNWITKIRPSFSQDGHLTRMPAFDQLRARLLLADSEQRPTTFLITSPEPGTGKSTVAANLAVSLSEGGDRVVLIDMDFRRPRLHSIFKLPYDKGLCNFMQGEIKLEAAIQKTTHPNLWVIVAGSSSHVPSEWLMPKKMDRLLIPLTKKYDYILIDTPAMLSVADPTVLAARAEAVILVVAKRKTQRQNLRFTLQQLAELKVMVVGIVMNKMPYSQLYEYYSEQSSKHSPIWQRVIKKRTQVSDQSKQTGSDDEKGDAVLEPGQLN